MNNLTQLLADSSATWWQYLLHATWQSTLLAVALLTVVAARPKWPAPLRHGLILLALLKFAVPPLLAAPRGVSSWPRARRPFA